MRSIVAAVLEASLVAVSCAGCTADPELGAAQQAWCSGLVPSNVVARTGTSLFLTPDYLATSAEAWGPQVLALSVDQGFSPQVSYQETPSVSLAKNKVTDTLQAALGFSLSQSINLTASTNVAVPTDAYYRLEAYPEYQVVDFELHRDACGPMAPALVTTGSVYRPVGIYFRVMVYVGGEWNALKPPSPSEMPVPPSLATPASPDAGAGL